MKTRPKSKAIVEPSARDSISAWLDVLTSMLALPEHQRAQVRDELEDHLRSRVDDLLITGLDEPDAIRKAVSELGETAELAKVVTNAHTQPTQRRRIMQSVLITAAIAGMSIGGFSLMTSTGNTSAPQVPVVGAVDTEPEKSVDPARIEGFNLENVSLFDAVTQVADRYGMSVDFSQTPEFIRDSSLSAADLMGKYNLDLALGTLESQYAMQFGYRLLVDGNRIVVLSEDGYARYHAVTMVYSIDWADEATAHEVFDTVDELFSQGRSDGITIVRKVASSLVIYGDPDIQIEAEKMVTQLMHVYMEARTAKLVEHRDRIRRIDEELERVRNELRVAHDKEIRIANSMRELENASDLNSVMDQYAGQQELLRDQRLQIKDLEKRYNYLSELLIEQEYLELSGRPLPENAQKPRGLT